MGFKCRSCGAPVLWALSGGGKSMPLDAVPVPDGNVELRPSADPRCPPVAHTLGKPGPPGLRYKSHPATCPDSKRWRRAQ